MKLKEAVGTTWKSYWTLRRIVCAIIAIFLIPVFAKSIIFSVSKAKKDKARYEKLEKTYTATVEGKLDYVHSDIEYRIAWFPLNETVTTSTVSYEVGGKHYTYNPPEHINGIDDPPKVHYDPEDPNKCFVESEKEIGGYYLDFAQFRGVILAVLILGLFINLKPNK